MISVDRPFETAFHGTHTTTWKIDIKGLISSFLILASTMSYNMYPTLYLVPHSPMVTPLEELTLPFFELYFHPHECMNDQHKFTENEIVKTYCLIQLNATKRIYVCSIMLFSVTATLPFFAIQFPILITTDLRLIGRHNLDLDREIEKDLNLCNEMYMDDNATRQYHQTLKHSLDILQEHIPANYSANFRNPCWYDFHQIPSNLLNLSRPCVFPASVDPSQAKRALQQVKSSSERQLHCLPAFFLSGFPKCGTTSLDAMIRQHPQVARSRCKECGFWSRLVSEHNIESHTRILVLWYLSLFSQSAQKIESSQQSITWDASITYNLYLSNDYCVLPVLLKRVLPEAKFVLIMRNPTERYSSHYWFITVRQRFTNRTEFIQYGHTKKALESFQNDTVHVIKQFQSCVDSVNSIMSCVLDTASILSGLQQGLYYYHTAPWLRIIPRERFLFLRTEDLAHDPSLTMSKVWHFLNLDNLPETKSVFINEGPVNKNVAVPPQIKKLINEFYQPYNQLLAHLLSDTRYLWND